MFSPGRKGPGLWERSRAAKSKAAGTLCLPRAFLSKPVFEHGTHGPDFLDQRPVKISPSVYIYVFRRYVQRV